MNFDSHEQGRLRGDSRLWKFFPADFLQRRKRSEQIRAGKNLKIESLSFFREYVVSEVDPVGLREDGIEQPE